MPNFFLPLLHVDTVAEAYVDTLYSGRGKTIYLPGTMRFAHTLVSVRVDSDVFQGQH